MMEEAVKCSFNVKKAKAQTKGRKVLVSDNKSALKFYAIMTALSFFAHLLVVWLFRASSHLLPSILAFLLCLACVYVLRLISGTNYDDCDLASSGGTAEHVEDVIILLCILQVLSTYSSWLWLASLLLPLRVCYLFLQMFIPWVFAAPSPIEEEKAAKKAKKQQRKFIRHP